MKLRNKKTGKIGELSGVNRIVVYEYDMPLCGNSILGEYNTLAELNEEWEDYTPAEPLIKDEKVRKAVRAWADANSICRAIHYKTAVGTELIEINYEQPTDQKAAIEFNKYCGLEESKEYAIAELCGEEEE